MRWLGVVVFLFAISASSFGAIVLVQKVNPNTGGSCATTISANTAGNLLAVYCESDSGTYATSVTDNASGGSNTYTEVVGSRGGFAGTAVTNIFYSQTNHSGATVVTCNGTCFGTSVYEYSGTLASGSPVDTSSGSVSQGCIATACTGAPVTTLNAGDVIFTGIVPGNNITSVAAPYTNFLQNATNGNGSADYLPGTTVTASAAVWTDSSSGDTYGTSVAVFLPAASAVTPNFRQVIISE